jgi:hypothetical protein
MLSFEAAESRGLANKWKILGLEINRRKINHILNEAIFIAILLVNLW